jgi:predicted nuclease with TOPRIM domain
MKVTNEATDQEQDEMRERLARIETSLTHLEDHMKQMVRLMDRMIRLEEHVDEHRRDMSRVFIRLEKAEKELDTWRFVRRVMAWAAGISGTVIAGVIAFTGRFGGHG